MYLLVASSLDRPIFQIEMKNDVNDQFSLDSNGFKLYTAQKGEVFYIHSGFPLILFSF